MVVGQGTFLRRGQQGTFTKQRQFFGAGAIEPIDPEADLLAAYLAVHAACNGHVRVGYDHKIIDYGDQVSRVGRSRGSERVVGWEFGPPPWTLGGSVGGRRSLTLYV